MSEPFTVLRRHLVQFLPCWKDDPSRGVPQLGPKPEPCIVETLRYDRGDRPPHFGYRFVWHNKFLDVYHRKSNVYEDRYGELVNHTNEERMRVCEDNARKMFITWPIESWQLLPPNTATIDSRQSSPITSA